MQIHEITLKEAAPMSPAVSQNVAKLKQKRQSRTTAPVPQAPQSVAPQQPQLTPAQKLAQADAAELAIRRQKAAQIPGAGPVTQALGNYIANKIGPRGLPSQRAPGPTQAQLDAEMSKLKNQYPGLTDQQYQQALQQRATQMTAPTGTTVQQPATPAATTTKSAPVQGGSELQKAQAAGSPARLAVGDNRSELQIAAEPNSIAQRQLAQEPNKAAIPGEPLQQPASTAPAQATPAPAQTYPPITIGAGPKATVYVNKGKGYTDSKTGKPIPPAILKAMGPVQ